MAKIMIESDNGTKSNYLLSQFGMERLLKAAKVNLEVLRQQEGRMFPERDREALAAVTELMYQLKIY